MNLKKYFPYGTAHPASGAELVHELAGETDADPATTPMADSHAQDAS